MHHHLRRRLLTCLAVTLGTAVALVGVPAYAVGAAPSDPVLESPGNQSTNVPTPPRLSVAVSDPEGDDLRVRFFARERGQAGGTNTSPDFTLVAMPDTQNYVSVAANRAIMGAQTQWIADQRDALNVALVTHLGDVAGQPDSDSQFRAASDYMATLDSAGVPNTVLTGNHDMNVATGAAPLYDQYFPPSRYANASWNSPAVRYGGYLGQNLFGPDPVDRRNQDSFVLLTAGGMDFVVINLEFNAPDYALDWATKVLAAYPTRRAILITHNMIGVDGNFSYSVNRPGGNYPAAIWSKLVAPSCRFHLVVNGHNHAGDLGEAYRSMDDSCGQSVPMVLANYQSRVNGGDGWLRYFTFKPSQNLIQAVTYSPTRKAYETDADSSFTIPYSMGTPTAFAQVGEVSVASGGTASAPLTGATAGRTYEWYATVSDDTSTTTGPTWSFTTGSGTPAPTGALAADGFGRSVSNGWGRADNGGNWTVNGTTSRYAVRDGVGVQTVTAGATTGATLGSLGATGVDLTASLALGSIPNGATYSYVAARRVGSADYAARVKVSPGGATTLQLTRSGTVIANSTLTTTLSARERLQVRVRTEGTAPTTIRARAWKVGSTEPSGWQASATDSTAALQSAGGIGLSTYLSSSTTNGPLSVSFDNLAVTALGGGGTPAPDPGPAPGPIGTTLGADTFARTSANGWGTADTGGAWAVNGTASRYAVSGGVGSQQLAPGTATLAVLGSLTSTASDTTVRVSVPAAQSGGAVYVFVGGRRVGSTEYGARVKVDPGGALSLHTARGDTALRGASLGTSLAAGESLLIRVQVQGTTPSTVRVKAWKATASEPAGWHATSTDSTAVLQSAGGVSLRAYASSSVTSGQVGVRFDDLAVRSIG